MPPSGREKILYDLQRVLTSNVLIAGTHSGSPGGQQMQEEEEDCILWRQ